MGRRAQHGQRQSSLQIVRSAVQMVVEQLEQRVFLSINAPSNLVASGTASPGYAAAIRLDWLDHSSNETSFKIERKTGSGGTYSQIGTADASDELNGTYIDSTISAGTPYYYRLRAATDTEDSTYSNESDAIEWTSANVGTATGGSWNVDGNGVGTMVSNGAGMSGGSDNFRFAYRTLNGDGTIVARVTGVQWTNPMARAAVMFRNTLNANSKSAFLAIMPNGSAQWSYRRNDGDNAQQSSISNQGAPRWVKLVRSGSMFTASVSSDGQSWTQVGQANISMNANVYVGLALSASEYSGGYNTSTFSNITVTRQDHTLPAGWTNQDIGTNPFAGTAGYSNDGTYTFTVESSGQLVGWGSDNFHFAHQTLTGDGEIIAHVATMVGQDGGGYYPYALAGVMFRDGLAANARTALMAISGGDGARWQYRTTTGGNATEKKVAGITVPYWVRLTRSGNIFTGYRSSDGNSWTQVDSPITIDNMPQSLEVGLMLNAAGYGSVNTSSFDHVSILAAPTLTATAVHARRVDLSWTGQAWGGVLRYVLERSEDNGSTWSQVGGDINAAGYIDSSAQPETNYKYRVKAKNSDGGPWTSGWSAVSDASTVGLGDGLAGTYWNNQDFTGTTATQVDEQISFQWSSGESPAAGIDGSTFAAEWKGRIKASATGTYTFTTFADDGVRVWVNDQLVIDRWNIQSPTTTSGTIGLTADQKYNLRIEYFQDFQSGDLTLSWTVPETGVSVLVPTANLYSDTSQIPAAPAAPANVTAFAPTSTKSFQAGIPDEPQVHVSWTAVSGAHRYNVYRTLDGGQTYEWVGTTANTSISDKDGVVNGTNYQYRVVAVGAGGHSAPTEALLTPDVSVQVLGDSEVRLTWSDINTDEEGYRIDRSDDNGVTWQTVAIVDANSTSYIDSGLEAGHSYLYRVSAVSSMVVSVPDVTPFAVPASVPEQLGVRSRFFARHDLSGAGYETVYPGIDFALDWGSGSPMKGKIAKGPFSAIFDTTFVAPAAGEYTFQIKANGGVRLFVGNTKVYDHWSDIPRLQADFNNDGAVNFFDLTTMAANYGGSNMGLAQGDANGDGAINFYDLTALSAIYGQSEGSVTQTSSTISLQANQQYALRAEYFNLYGQAELTITAKLPGAEDFVPLSNIPVKVQQVPAAPTNLAATANSSSQITITWTDNSGEEDPPISETGFRIERKGGASDQWADVAVVGTNVTSYVDSNLRASTAYTYRVRAFNGGGASSASSEVAQTTLATSSSDTVAPGLTGSVTAVGTSPTSVFLSWLYASDGNGTPYYQITRNDQLVATRSATNFLDTGLTPGTDYTYKIRAFDAAGNPSAELTKTYTTPPALPTVAAPTGASADYVGASVKVDWDRLPGMSYDISRDGVFLARAGASAFFDTALPGTHTYAITAIDSNGKRSVPASTGPVSVPDADPAADANQAADQFIPDAWMNYFYDQLVPALRQRYEMIPAAARNYNTAPPSSKWFDPGESVLRLDSGNAQTRTWQSMSGSVALYYLDRNGNSYWNSGEAVWINKVGDSSFSTGDTVVLGTPELGSPGTAGHFYSRDSNANGIIEPAEVQVRDWNLLKGTAGDLRFLALGVSPRYSAIWKDVTANSIFDGDDVVVYDPQNYLTATNKQNKVIWGNQNGLAFYDADADSEWSEGEPIWEDVATSFAWWSQQRNRTLEGDTAGGLKSEVLSFYAALESIVPFFGNSAVDPTSHWDMPGILNDVAGILSNGTGQVKVTAKIGSTLTIQGIGTSFTTELEVGDWIEFGDKSYQVNGIESNSVLSVFGDSNTPISEDTFSFTRHSWTRTEAEYGIEKTRGVFQPKGILGRVNFQELKSALEKLTTLADVYGVSRFDATSSAAFLAVAVPAINAYTSVFGSTDPTETGTRLGNRIRQGFLDPGAVRYESDVDDLQAVTDALMNQVYVRGAVNGWEVTSYDPNLPPQSNVVVKFGDTAKREALLPATARRVAGSWSTPLDAVDGWWVGGGGNIHPDHVSELDSIVQALVSNGLWISATGNRPVTTDRLDYYLMSGEVGDPPQIDDIDSWTGSDDHTPPEGTYFNEEYALSGGPIGSLTFVAFPGATGSYSAFSAKGTITLPSTSRGAGLQPWVSASFGPDATITPSWGSTTAILDVSLSQVVDIFKDTYGVVGSYRDATTGLYVTSAYSGGGSPVASITLDFHLLNQLFGEVALGTDLAHTPSTVSSPTLTSPASLPGDALVPTTELDYRNVIADTDEDGIVQIDHDQLSFGNDTGSIVFEANNDLPQVYLPIFTNEWAQLPINAYLVQGGFASAIGQPALLTRAIQHAFVDEGGLPYAYSLNTRVRTNLLLNDAANHIKRIEVIRPHGNAVVFDFAWDDVKKQFSDVGFPKGWSDRDSKRLYTLHATGSGYQLRFASGMIHNFDSGGALASVENVDGRKTTISLTQAGRISLQNPSGSPSQSNLNVGTAQSPRYDVKVNWLGGHIQSIDYVTRADAGKKITTTMGPTTGATASTPIASLDKKDAGNTAIPAFSYTYDSNAGSLAHGGSTWTRSGSTTDTTNGVTLTRTLADVPAGTYAIKTVLNAAGLVTSSSVILNGGTPATTSYVYQSGTDRYAGNQAAKWGKIVQVSYPTGSWERFEYDANTGWITKRVSPFQSSLAGTTSDDAHRVEIYGYAESDGEAADGPNAVKLRNLTERPRSVESRTLGKVTGSTLNKYMGRDTYTRQLAEGESWNDAALRQTKIFYSGDSDFIADTKTATHLVTRTATINAAGDGFRIDTTKQNVAGANVGSGQTIFNAYGAITSSNSSDDVGGYTNTVTTPSLFGFGRIEDVTNVLSGRKSTATFATGDWFGPSQVKGEDNSETTIQYTAWGGVSNRATFGVTTAYKHDAAGNVVETKVTGGGLSQSNLASFDSLGRTTWSKGSDQREININYGLSQTGQTITTTLNDGSNVVETFFLDGSRNTVGGSASYASAYSSGVDASKGFWVHSSSNDDKNWEKTYFNMLGQAYEVEHSGPNNSGGANILRASTGFDALGRPVESVGFDGTLSYTQYDEERGYVSDSILDVNKNGKYDGGVDRNTSYFQQWVSGNLSDTLTGPYLQQITTMHGGSAPYTPDTLSIASSGASGLWSAQSAYGLTTTTEVIPKSGEGEFDVLTTYSDHTYSLERYEQGLLQTSQQLNINASVDSRPLPEEMNPASVISTQTYDYDTLRRLTSTSDLFGTTTWRINGTTGELDEVTLPGDRTYKVPSTTDARWSRDGTPLQVQRPDGKIATQQLNNFGQTTGAYGAGTLAQQFTYNPTTGALASLTTSKEGWSGINGANIATTSWNFNDYTGQFQDKNYPGQVSPPSIVNAYNQDTGQLNTTTVGGIVGTSGYNDAGEVNSFSMSGLTQTVLSRDAKGRVLATQRTADLPGGGSETYRTAVGYDSSDRLASEEAGVVAGVQVKYEYFGPNENGLGEAAGQIKAMKVKRGDTLLWSINYVYDDTTKRLKTFKTSNGNTNFDKTYTYNFKPGTNLVASLSSAGAVSSSLDYETTTGRWNKLEQKKTAGGTHLFSSDWTFNQGTPATDNNQKLKVNVTQTTLDTSIPAGSYWWDYDYDKDNADQLKSATRKANSGGQTVTTASYNYTFDGIGNRIDKAYAPNSANQYTINPDAANAPITYDPRGNMTSDGVFDFTWNSAGQLTSGTPKTVVTLEQEADPNDGVDGPASRKVEFGYDDLGRRIWKKTYVYSSAASAWLANQTRKFVYDGNNLVAEFVVDPNGMDRLSRTYAWGKGIAGNVGGLLSITTFADDGSTPTATYIPLYDDRGNVVGLANATDGKLVAVYQYDPFGKLIGEAGDKAVLDANPFMFSTKYFDRETGLYDFGFRYYSPILQRWISRDPIAEAGGVNLYTFCGNDPVNAIDPNGLEVILPSQDQAPLGFFQRFRYHQSQLRDAFPGRDDDSIDEEAKERALEDLTPFTTSGQRFSSVEIDQRTQEACDAILARELHKFGTGIHLVNRINATITLIPTLGSGIGTMATAQSASTFTLGAATTVYTADNMRSLVTDKPTAISAGVEFLTSSRTAGEITNASVGVGLGMRMSLTSANEELVGRTNIFSKSEPTVRFSEGAGTTGGVPLRPGQSTLDEVLSLDFTGRPSQYVKAGGHAIEGRSPGIRFSIKPKYEPMLEGGKSGFAVSDPVNGDPIANLIGRKAFRNLSELRATAIEEELHLRYPHKMHPDIDEEWTDVLQRFFKMHNWPDHDKVRVGPAPKKGAN